MISSRRGFITGGAALAAYAALRAEDASAQSMMLRLRGRVTAPPVTPPPPSSGVIPSDAITLNTLGDVTTAINSGASGANYVLAARTWEQIGWNTTTGAGASRTAPINIYMQPGAVVSMIGLNNISNVNFRYVTVTNGAYTASNSNNCIQAVHCTNVGFDHCRTVNAPSLGLLLRFSSACWVKWFRADNCALGFAPSTSDGITVEDLLVDGFSADAIDLFGTTNSTLTRIMVRNPQLVGDGHPDSCQIASDFPNSPETRTAHVTITDLNFDRAGGTQTNGPCFGDGHDFVSYNNIASFGSNTNGISVSNATNCTANNCFLQGYDYGPQGIVRGGSVNTHFTNVHTVSGCTDVTADGNTGTVFTNCTNIAQAVDVNDRASYLAFLAANPTIPVLSHWDNQGFL